MPIFYPCSRHHVEVSTFTPNSFGSEIYVTSTWRVNNDAENDTVQFTWDKQKIEEIHCRQRIHKLLKELNNDNDA